MRTIFSSLLAISFAVLTAVPAAAATCGNGIVEWPEQCEPQKVNAGFEGVTVLVGCCNANCTWKTGTDAARSCILPSNVCRKYRCNEYDPVTNPTPQCNVGSGSNVTNGTSCNPNEQCRVGECYGGVCQEIDNVTGNWGNRCENQGDTGPNAPCTNDDICIELPGGAFGGCTTGDNNERNGLTCNDGNADLSCSLDQCSAGVCVNIIAPLDTFCGTVNGATCTPKKCDGVDKGDVHCIQNGNPITCSEPSNLCKKATCTYNGSTPVCGNANRPLGDTNCDVNDWDCKEKYCNGSGTCKSPNRADLSPCESDNTTPLANCTHGICDRGACVNDAPEQHYTGHEGALCQTDTNSCSFQHCYSGVCVVDACGTNTTVCSTGCNGSIYCPGGGTPPSCNACPQ